jgi:hypothetical protein
VRRGTWLLGILLFGFSAWTASRAAEAPDDGLLEFLGSVDAEGKDWRDYLARTDIDRVARRAGGGAPPAASVPVAPNPTPADPPRSPPPPANAGNPVGSP